MSQNIKIEEVLNAESEQQFLTFPQELYRNDESYIQPLDDDIKKVFSKENRFYKNGRTKKWLAISKGNVVGRIAAFHSSEFSFKGDFKLGGIGFFESIDEQQVAHALFDQSIEWLKNEGVQVVDGPINLGERNAWWGLLVEGFTEPVYQMNYNHPYYQALFESYGFQLYFKQFSYGMKIFSDLGAKYYERGKRLSANPAYTVEHVKKSNLKKYAEDFRTVYNKAWVKHEGFEGMSEEKALKLMNTMKPVLVEDLMWFAYYNGEPIIAFINIPDLNQYFKHINGKLNLLGKAKYLYHKLRKTNKKVYSMVFGVVPRFQAKGLEGIILSHVQKYWQENTHWKDLELIWIGDFNPKMNVLARSIGGKVVKTHHTYRYMIDSSIAFERHPINN